jgi:RimJ/RimL family protein N-acetyltransferase
MGDGSPDPRPTFCVLLDGDVVGWVDEEERPDLLQPGERNIGWALHPSARGRGAATRAVRLLISQLEAERAVAVIEPDNVWSRRVATRAGFTDLGVQQVLDKPNHRFERVPPARTYTDGTVTIAPWRLDDVEAHVAGTDEEQIRWLWPEHRADWEAKSHEERIEHVRGVFERAIATNDSGPKWSFGVHVDGVLVGHVDCDLANEHVPHGEANISYTIWPEHRGRGHAAAAARLVTEFVREHTGARQVHVLVDPANEASLRVARAIGAVEVDRSVMVRHVIELRTPDRPRA